MRLYLTVWEDGREGGHEWTGTQADQRAVVKREGHDNGNDVVRNEPVDVPTSKPELLAFLNTFRLRPDLAGQADA